VASGTAPGHFAGVPLNSGALLPTIRGISDDGSSLRKEHDEVMTLTVNEVDVRAERMLHDEQVRADGMLSTLLLAHVPFGIGLAALHGYWVIGIVASLVLALTPLAVVRARPGTLLSRCTIAAAFAGFSALFIQEAHGMTELHFHIFAWLAFMALYRDWRAPAFGGFIVAVHHLVFHFLQAAGAGFWVFPAAWSGARGIEMVALHAGFVVFEVAVLIYISLALARETHGQAELLVTQQHDHDTMVALAEGLQARDLSIGATIGADEDADSAISTLRRGIGFVAELVQSIDRTAGSVASSSVDMATTTAEAGRASSEVAGSLSQLAEGAQRQVHAVAAARESAEQVGAAVASSAESASRTADAAQRVREAAAEGATAANEATVAAQAVSESSAQASQAIGELAAKSEHIGAIVQTITGIADQTNLLALNAAIEAARAGESGRGFAVVAEEVRKLAEESSQAAAAISQIVDQIQSETRLAVSVVEDGAQRTGQSAATAAQTRTAFERISEAVQEMTEQSEDISRATQQIAEGAERMAQEMESVAAVAAQASSATEHASAATQQTSASTQQVAASAEVLSSTAQELQALVGAFRLASAE
jgi:methyl-accepting chemotaxis protein